jgi:hypothetical protein
VDGAAADVVSAKDVAGDVSDIEELGIAEDDSAMDVIAAIDVVAGVVEVDGATDVSDAVIVDEYELRTEELVAASILSVAFAVAGSAFAALRAFK